MKTSDSVVKISEALAKAHSAIKHATKDAQNPHLKNHYATLESVIDASKDALLKNGIFVIQSPTGEVLTTRLQHTSGEFIESDLALFINKQDMQGLGSAITYARRYSLAALLNISQTDDDGNEANKDDGNKNQPSPKPQPLQAPAAKPGQITVEAKVTIAEKDLAKSAGFKWSGKKWVKNIDAQELMKNSYPFEILEVRS